VSRALVDAVTLAESFDLNDGPAHRLTMHFKVGLTTVLPELCLEIMPQPQCL
jgi:hypothetical protein